MWEKVKQSLKAIVESRLFWSSLLPIVTRLLFLIAPEFPRDLWDQILTLVSAILFILGVAVGTGQGVRRAAFLGVSTEKKTP